MSVHSRAPILYFSSSVLVRSVSVARARATPPDTTHRPLQLSIRWVSRRGVAKCRRDEKENTHQTRRRGERRGSLGGLRRRGGSFAPSGVLGDVIKLNQSGQSVNRLPINYGSYSTWAQKEHGRRKINEDKGNKTWRVSELAPPWKRTTPACLAAFTSP